MVLLIAMILMLSFMYIRDFHTYICLDLDEKKLIICEGLKKEEFSTIRLISITIEDYSKYPWLFSLNYNFAGYSKKDFGWSTGFNSRFFFASTKTQRKRLENFCAECNKYLQGN